MTIKLKVKVQVYIRAEVFEKSLLEYEENQKNSKSLLSEFRLALAFRANLYHPRGKYFWVSADSHESSRCEHMQCDMPVNWECSDTRKKRQKSRTQEGALGRA